MLAARLWPPVSWLTRCGGGQAITAPASHAGVGRAGVGRATGQQKRQVAPAGLDDGRPGAAQPLDLVGRQTGQQAAVDHRDGGRHGTVGAYLGLHRQRDFHVLRPGHAVADGGGFQRHHRPAGGQRGGHRGLQLQPAVGHRRARGPVAQGQGSGVRQPGQATLRQALCGLSRLRSRSSPSSSPWPVPFFSKALVQALNGTPAEASV